MTDLFDYFQKRQQEVAQRNPLSMAGQGMLSQSVANPWDSGKTRIKKSLIQSTLAGLLGGVGEGMATSQVDDERQKALAYESVALSQDPVGQQALMEAQKGFLGLPRDVQEQVGSMTMDSKVKQQRMMLDAANAQRAEENAQRAATKFGWEEKKQEEWEASADTRQQKDKALLSKYQSEAAKNQAEAAVAAKGLGMGVKDYLSYSKEVKKTQAPVLDMKQSYDGMSFAAQQTGRAGDIAMMYYFIKLLDPDSVVKEGELKLAAGANPLAENWMGRLQNIYESKGYLTDDVKKEMLDIARQRLSATYGRAQNEIASDREYVQAMYPKIAPMMFRLPETEDELFNNIQVDQASQMAFIDRLRTVANPFAQKPGDFGYFGYGDSQPKRSINDIMRGK